MTRGIFDGPVENNFKPLPEGMYHGYVSKLEIRTSKNGNDYLNIEFTLTNNRKAWDRLMWHNEACVNVMKGKLEGLGFTREERKLLDPDNHQELISSVHRMSDGREYEIKIGFDKDNNNVVKYYSDPNAPEEEAADPLDPMTEAPAMPSRKPRIENPFDK